MALSFDCCACFTGWHRLDPIASSCPAPGLSFCAVDFTVVFGLSQVILLALTSGGREWFGSCLIIEQSLDAFGLSRNQLPEKS